ncbi:MAG: Glycine--tRNA ligase beta subunit [Firmicutes bacterium ADurb.Bin153]|nr:MAG: Glycine--tRNA ligase beta subunit [Firmicutes bacterium ADurb.Bin153]
MGTVNRRDLLFELGIEEIPARFAAKAVSDIEALGRRCLEDERLKFDTVTVFATPRRLALYVEGLDEFQGSLDRRVKGPSLKVAYDASGNPGKAAIGFAKSQGVAVESLEKISDNGGDYVYANVHEEGKRIDSVIPGICDSIIRSLAFPKNMRWGESDFRFVRPIRWIVLLWGDEVLGFTFEGIEAGDRSFGHRTLGPNGPIRLHAAETYKDAMRSAGVIVDQQERAGLISEQVRSAAQSAGGEADMDPGLLEEVNYIVEMPTAFIGRFDEKYLKLPEICVTTPMMGHQRYFPIRRDGKLMNSFVAVRNGGTHGIDNVRHGNERVLAARLADAEFFFEEDMSRELAGRLEALEGITFAEGLGSMKDKTLRIEKLSAKILATGDRSGMPGKNESVMLSEAALLSKCDLATNMVKEFTELQGEIGSIYAGLEGKDKTVSMAIAEHYLPKSTGAELPSTRIGACLAMGDKADSLAGYFGLGKIPTGSTDPFALRRSALGLMAIHEQRNPGMDVAGMLKEAVDGIWAEASPRPKEDILKDLGDFMEGRLKGQLIDEGHRYDLVDAAMSLGYGRPSSVRVSLGALEKDLGEGWMEEMATAFVRVRNIARDAADSAYDEEMLTEAAEKDLSGQLAKAKDEIGRILEGDPSVEGYAKAMSRFAGLKPAIDRFFDEVMVMCEDEAVRRNRLGLVKSVETTALRLADFSRITALK